MVADVWIAVQVVQPAVRWKRPYPTATFENMKSRLGCSLVLELAGWDRDRQEGMGQNDALPPSENLSLSSSMECSSWSCNGDMEFDLLADGLVLPHPSTYVCSILVRRFPRFALMVYLLLRWRWSSSQGTDSNCRWSASPFKAATYITTNIKCPLDSVYLYLLYSQPRRHFFRGLDHCDHHPCTVHWQ